MLCAFLGLRNISATLGAVGNNEFLLQLPALDRLMLAGALVLAGFAVQAVAERHWIRPLGSLGILGGLPLAAMATAVSRGWTQKPGVLAVGAVAFGAAAAWVWWIDRHDVRAALARRPSRFPNARRFPNVGLRAWETAAAGGAPVEESPDSTGQRCWLTARRGDPTESATERRPPMDRVTGHRQG